MSKILIGFGGLLVGLAVGVFLIGGAATGVGVATGLSAGICSTVEAAMEEDLLTEASVDQVLTRAAEDLAVMTSGDAPEAEIVGSAAECADLMERIATAAE